MAATFRFHPQAVPDLDAAFEWYLGRSPNAASQFLTRLRATIDLAMRHPDAGRSERNGARSLLLPGYPYFLIYRADDRGILILAVAHTSRRPAYWRGRREDS